MRIHYITVATKPHSVLDNIKNKVDNNNESIHILGENEKRYIGWNANGNFGLKIKLVQDYLFNNNLQDEDIILFTDAYDVIYHGDFSLIYSKFCNFNKPIVFGAETCCNPDTSLQKYYNNINYTFPYLNSGLYIGKVWALKECLRNYKYDDNHDDQLFWTHCLLRYPDKIELDYNNELFLNTHNIDIEDICINKSVIHFKNKTPIFIHVNGPNKSDLDKFL